METPIGKREISVPGIVMRPKAKRTLNNIIERAIASIAPTSNHGQDVCQPLPMPLEY